MSANLVRFQLPGNWAVCYNSFGDEDMIVEDGWIKNFPYYKEDLLWLQALRRTENVDIGYELDPNGWLVDVGWYPDSDPNGTYALRAFRGSGTSDYAEHPTFRSRNRQDITAVLEHIVAAIYSCNESEAIVRQRLLELQILHEQGELLTFLSRPNRR